MRPLRTVGPQLLIIFGDTLVLDRFLWLMPRLPKNPCSVVDAGCGNGWLAMICSARGHNVMGLGWSEADVAKARRRAARFGLTTSFQVQDLRHLSKRPDLHEMFDLVTCTETIEHILDDERLMTDLRALLRPGGRLLLTTPSNAYIPMGTSDSGPFSTVEDGSHVRKGYCAEDLRRLCTVAGLDVTDISYCSGWWSQHVTKLLRRTQRPGQPVHKMVWGITLPLRLMPPLLDRRHGRYPPYTICLVAERPRQDVPAEPEAVLDWAESKSTAN